MREDAPRTSAKSASTAPPQRVKHARASLAVYALAAGILAANLGAMAGNAVGRNLGLLGSVVSFVVTVALVVIGGGSADHVLRGPIAGVLRSGLFRRQP
jgi:hypothetical protein